MIETRVFDVNKESLTKPDHTARDLRVGRHQVFKRQLIVSLLRLFAKLNVDPGNEFCVKSSKRLYESSGFNLNYK